MPTVPDLGSMNTMGEYDEYLQGQRPSPTQVLLAAGTMHNQGHPALNGPQYIGFGGAAPQFKGKVGSPGRAMPVRGRRK